MIIGDSLSRFQYMNLVYFLHKEWPEDSGLVEGAFNPCREAWGQGGWGFFYPNSSSGLEVRPPRDKRLSLPCPP